MNAVANELFTKMNDASDERVRVAVKLALAEYEHRRLKLDAILGFITIMFSFTAGLLVGSTFRLP